jgi:hypothetical protein
MEERYPSIPQKSRKRILFICLHVFSSSSHIIVFVLWYVADIIIEKWLPYPRQPERREIVEHAPDAIKYPEPFHTITNYRKVRTRTHQNFDNHVVDENPRHYKACHGASLLDPEKLVQEAAKAGVTADKLVNAFQTKKILRNFFNF